MSDHLSNLHTCTISFLEALDAEQHFGDGGLMIEGDTATAIGAAAGRALALVCGHEPTVPAGDTGETDAGTTFRGEMNDAAFARVLIELIAHYSFDGEIVTVPHKQHLLNVAEALGPDRAQTLFHIAKLITKFA